MCCLSSYLQTSAHRTSDDAKHFMKKQIANHAFVKENRHISSRSVSLQFTFMRTLMLQRQTKTLKLALVVAECWVTLRVTPGLHRAGGSNASLRIACLTWIPAIHTRSRTSLPNQWAPCIMLVQDTARVKLQQKHPLKNCQFEIMRSKPKFVP